MKKMKLLAILSLIVSSVTYSNNIQLDSSKLQNTTIQQGKRGNTIININTPNEKGISVNDFENFQTKNGVVFNNSNTRYNMSQLEGMISGNPNISDDQAKLILNRVGGSNRTEIEGALEAVGKEKVNMIFSSPNGIYVNGSNFIGFKNVEFSTGEYTDEGYINFEKMSNAKVEIGRNGLNALDLERLSILTKNLDIDGPIQGKNIQLGIDDGMIKGMKISSSEFGSIYGDQISIYVDNGEIGVKGDIIGENVVSIYGDKIEANNIYSFNNDISLNGKEVILNGDVFTPWSLTIQAERAELKGENIEVNRFDGSDITTLLNNSNISSNDFYGKNLINYGTIKTDMYLGSVVKNFGNLEFSYIKEPMLLFENEATGIVKMAGGINSKQIINNGIINFQTCISLNFEEFKNNGILGGSMGILDIYGKNFENTGNIDTLGSININTEKMVNAGLIHSDSSVNTRNKETINKGTLTSGGYLHLKSEKLDLGGTVNTKNLVLSTKQLKINGLISAESVSFESYSE